MSGVVILKDKLTAIHQCAMAEPDTLAAALALLESISDDAADALDVITGWCGSHARVQDIQVFRPESPDRFVD